MVENLAIKTNYCRYGDGGAGPTIHLNIICSNLLKLQDQKMNCLISLSWKVASKKWEAIKGGREVNRVFILE